MKSKTYMKRGGAVHVLENCSAIPLLCTELVIFTFIQHRCPRGLSNHAQYCILLKSKCMQQLPRFAEKDVCSASFQVTPYFYKKYYVLHASAASA